MWGSLAMEEVHVGVGGPWFDGFCFDGLDDVVDDYISEGLVFSRFLDEMCLPYVVGEELSKEVDDALFDSDLCSSVCRLCRVGEFDDAS